MALGTTPLGKFTPKNVLESISKTSSAQSQCEAKGGKWIDGDCVMPEQEPKKEPEVDTSNLPASAQARLAEDPNARFGPKKEPLPGEIQTFKDVETGRLSGLQVGDRGAAIGLSPEEVVEGATKESLKQELPIGGQAEAVLERQRQGLQSAGLDLATAGQPTLDEEAIATLQSQFSERDINYLGAVFSAVPGIIPDLLSGAAIGGGAVFGASAALAATPIPGARVASAATIGTAAAITGSVNAIKGFFLDFISDVKRQQSAIIETPIRTLSETKPTLNDIVNSQNANPGNFAENNKAFWTGITIIDMEREFLKDITDGSLDDFLGDTGINQMQEYDVFYLPGGERERLIFDWNEAVTNPDPSRIRVDAITAADIKKRIDKELS